MVRPLEYRVGGSELLEPAEVEHCDPVRDVPDDTEVVRDEQVRHALLGLELDEQVEDRGLHRDVECRRRLVAHHELGIPGERARDGDALLEPARELHGLLRERALGQPYARGEVVHPLLRGSSRDAGELAEGAKQDAAHRVPAVEGRVRVLEDDLERT